MDIVPNVEHIYEPQGKTTADVLFIHGIRHDREQTWCCSPTEDTWILQPLPLDLRIGCWSCTIREPGHLDDAEIQNATDKLLEALQRFRDDTPDRPITFIAHSFGGVILKQALVTASNSSTRSILKSIVGILFLSVPISFPSEDSWNKFLNNISSSDEVIRNYTGENIDHTPVQKSGSQKDLIARVHGSFRELFSEKSIQKYIWNPRIYSICESLPVHGTEILIPPETAIIIEYPSKTVATDHFSLISLDYDADLLYRWIYKWLKAVSHRDVKSIDRLEKRLPLEPQKSQENSKDIPDGRREILGLLPKDTEARRLISYALHLEDEGCYISTETAWISARDTCEGTLDRDHLATLFCRDKLVYNYWHQGNYKIAGDQCQTLVDFKRNRPSHDMLATTRNRVLILRSQSKLQEAYEMLVRDLETTPSEKSSGLNYLPNLYLLALLLGDLGHNRLSEYLFREVVQECEIHLGLDHPYTLKRMSDLSVVLTKRGKLQRANEYNLLAYKGLELRYGMDHPAVLRVFKRYATNKLYQGEFDESCKAFETLLPRYQDKMDDTHLACLSTMSWLGTVYVLQGSVEQGKRLLQRAYNLYKDRPEENHRATNWTCSLLKLLDEYDPRKKGDSSNGSIYQEKFKTFLQGTLGHDEPDLMPYVNLSFIATDEEGRTRIALLKSGSNTPPSLSSKKQTHYTTSFYGGITHIAAYSDNRELIRRLLRRKVNINQKAGIFQTPLKAAAMQGNINIIKQILDHRDSSKSDDSPSSLTPLDTAIAFGQKDAIKLLQTRYRAHKEFLQDYDPEPPTTRAKSTTATNQDDVTTMKSDETIPVSPSKDVTSLGTEQATENTQLTFGSVATADVPLSVTGKTAQPSRLSSLVIESTPDQISVPLDNPTSLSPLPEKDEQSNFPEASPPADPLATRKSLNERTKPVRSGPTGLIKRFSHKGRNILRKKNSNSAKQIQNTGEGTIRKMRRSLSASWGQDSGYGSGNKGIQLWRKPESERALENSGHRRKHEFERLPETYKRARQVHSAGS